VTDEALRNLNLQKLSVVLFFGAIVIVSAFEPWTILCALAWAFMVLPVVIELRCWPEHKGFNYFMARWFHYSRRGYILRSVVATVLVHHIATHYKALSNLSIIGYGLTIYVLVLSHFSAPPVLRTPTTFIGRRWEAQRIHREQRHH
jgi:hypothetical protein